MRLRVGDEFYLLRAANRTQFGCSSIKCHIPPRVAFCTSEWLPRGGGGGSVDSNVHVEKTKLTSYPYDSNFTTVI